jgi:hypothetical protein
LGVLLLASPLAGLPTVRWPPILGSKIDISFHVSLLSTSGGKSGYKSDDRSNNLLPAVGRLACVGSTEYSFSTLDEGVPRVGQSSGGTSMVCFRAWPSVYSRLRYSRRSLVMRKGPIHLPSSTNFVDPSRIFEESTMGQHRLARVAARMCDFMLILLPP